jgi:hypothetical protein
VMLAASWNNWCSSPGMMCVAALSSCSTRLCIACLVLSKLQSFPIQLRLAQAKLVTCLASKRSQRHWGFEGLVSLLVIVLESCGLICCMPKYIIIEAPKTNWPCNVRPQGVRIINNSFTMSFSLTSCLRYIQPCSPLGQPGTSSFSFNVQSWSTEYVCGQCGVQPWFECCHSSCMIPLRKNVFHTLKQLRAHARHWHVQLASVKENSLVLDTVCCTDNSDSNCSYTDEFEDVQQLKDASVVNASLPFSFVKTGTAQFANWCIAGSLTQAIRCVVLQSLLQAPVSVYLDTSLTCHHTPSTSFCI